MIKVVVTDIDDTLLNENEVLSAKTIETVEKCIAEDVKVILASGRPDFGMYQFVEKLKLDSYDNYLLSYNGAKLENIKTGEVIYDKLLEVDRLKFLVDKAMEHNCNILTYQDGKVLTNKDNEYAAWEANALKTELVVCENLKDKIVEKAAKVIILEEPERAKIVKEQLSQEIGDVYEVAMSKPFFIEVNDKGISKGKALEVLCEHLKITNKEMFAIGDGLNDLSMIQFAGLGVAMGNANPLLKEQADVVTVSNAEEGFSVAVEQYVLNK